MGEEMTVVAWDGKILAADRIRTYGDMLATGTKIKRLDDGSIIAMTADIINGQRMMKWYAAGAKKEKYPKTDKDGGFALLIVADKNGCRSYYSDRDEEPVEVEDSFFAWGVGREAAIGALEMGADAVRAVEVASKWVAGCGRGVDYFEVKK